MNTLRGQISCFNYWETEHTHKSPADLYSLGEFIREERQPMEDKHITLYPLPIDTLQRWT
jgi:hypothetical protein